jgi:Fe-Mn family superoxide dismutase
MAQYEPKAFSHLLGTPGFGDDLLLRHFELYAGHVANLNALSDELAARPMNGAPSPDWCELKRRFGWEWNGARLHELYFENLTRSPSPPEKSSDVARGLAADFGSFQSWMRDFRATGCIRGVGWTALVRDGAASRLRNVWIGEHDSGVLVGCPIILLMDVFEHAYVGTDRSKRVEYIDAFLAAADWTVAGERLTAASAVLHPARTSRLDWAMRPLSLSRWQRDPAAKENPGAVFEGSPLGPAPAVVEAGADVGDADPR